MKRIAKIILLLFTFMFLVVLDAEALNSVSYYHKATITPVGQGKVYGATDDSFNPAARNWKSTGSSMTVSYTNTIYYG